MVCVGACYIQKTKLPPHPPTVNHRTHPHSTVHPPITWSPPIGHHTPNSHTPLEFSRNVSLRCCIHNIDMNSIRGMVHCEDCESDTEGFTDWSKLVLFLCICFLFFFSCSKCIKCIKRKRLQVDFFNFYFFAEHIVKVLHWIYSTVIVWFCIAIVSWFILFVFLCRFVWFFHLGIES